MFRRSLFLTGMLLISLAPLSATGAGVKVRLKDLGVVRGVRSNPLTGYGLVVGLAGTGDSRSAQQTIQTLTAALSRHGIQIDPRDVRSRNVAAVMVTSELAPFSHSGQHTDAHVASIGDSRSLEGGVLLITELLAANGEVFALAQGPVAVGGFVADQAGSSAKKNTPTSGTVTGGVILERDAPTIIPEGGYVYFDLQSPDFTLATRASEAINKLAGSSVANAMDAGSISIKLPIEGKQTGEEGEAAEGEEEKKDLKVEAENRQKIVAFLANIETASLETDVKARVVVSERTGTIVAGGDVRVSPVVVAHGGLTVEVKSTNAVSQPNPFAPQGAETRDVQNSGITVDEQQAKLVAVGGEVTITELASSLNKLGASPRDLVALLEAMRAAGALHAELIVR